MKKTIIYILILALVMAGLSSAMTGCAAKEAVPPDTSTMVGIQGSTHTGETETQDPTEPSVLVTTAPSAPAAAEPSAPATTEPSAPATTGSSAPAITEPSAPATTDPSAPAATESSVPESTESSVSAPTEVPSEKQEGVSNILTDALSKLAENVPNPNFGTLVGEWTVLCLARGNYYEKNDAYFAGYYSRIQTTVAQTAASVNQNGALHRAKSTENSRLIVALSAIGKDATNVAGWNLITPYDNFNWILKQGINGPIWALIALDTENYQTNDPTIRQQCIDHILQKQLGDGGWALTGKVSDPDITAMALQALYPYRQQKEVKAAADKGFECLSALQQPTGGYVTFGDENSESSAQVIVACATWGINPDTDSRFIKNGVSVLDAFLAYYVKEESGFKHIQSGKVDAMATDQGCYALIAYQRLLDEKSPLYDMRDVSR